MLSSGKQEGKNRVKVVTRVDFESPCVAVTTDGTAAAATTTIDSVPAVTSDFISECPKIPRRKKFARSTGTDATQVSAPAADNVMPDAFNPDDMIKASDECKFKHTVKDVTRGHVVDWQSIAIPCRKTANATKLIDCNDGKQRLISTVLDQDLNAQKRSKTLTHLLLLEVATKDSELLKVMFGGVNRGNGPHCCTQRPKKSDTPFLKLLAAELKEKANATLFWVTCVNCQEADEEQAFLKKHFPSVTENVVGYLTPHVTSFHEDCPSANTILAQGGHKSFAIDHGGQKCQQNLDDDASNVSHACN